MRLWIILALVLLTGLGLISGCAVTAALPRDQGTPHTPTAGEPVEEPVEESVAPAPEPFYGTGLIGLTPITLGYRLSLQGAIQPYMRVEGGALVLDLPGAALAPTILPPPEVRVELVEPEPVIDPMAGANVLTGTVPTRMPSGGVRLTLPRPAGPYALYRTEPGVLELRVLPPGLAGKVIVLDPGHGGAETGAITAGGYPEKALNLAVAQLLRPMLEAAGAQVIMTRSEDTRVAPPGGTPFPAAASLRNELMERAAISNRAGADLYLSIHGNGGPPGMGGIETFWSLRNLNANRSVQLSRLIQEELLRVYGFADRGVKQRSFSVIRNAEAPAALAELGFLTLPQEAAVLVSPRGQEQAARALFRAIERYFAGPG